MYIADKEAVFLGIVALPSAEVSDCAFQFVDQIAARTTLSSCIHRTMREPHATLFQGFFPIAQSGQVLARPLDYALTFHMQPALELRENGNVFWNVVPSDVLMETHLRLHADLHPLTEGRLVERFRHMATDPARPPDERAHIQRYGSVLAGPRFSPHLTLGCAMDPEQARGVLEEIRPPPLLSFSVSALRVAALREDGSIYRLLPC